MGKHNKDLPARPDSSRERERERERDRERDAMRDRSRSRAPSNSSSSSALPFPDYYIQRGGMEDQRCAPPPPSRRQNRDDLSDHRSHQQHQQQPPLPPSQPSYLQKSRKNVGVPKLTIRKPEEREPYLPEIQSAGVGTPSSGFASKFGRGRSKTKESPTVANYPQTPGDTPNLQYPSSPPPPMPTRRPSEPPGSSGSAQRSSSTDGRITSKLKASKAVIQQEKQKWQQKSQIAWGKLTSKSNPKSAVFAPSGFGTFPQKPPVDVVGMPLPEATTRTRVAKELVPGVDAAAYWLPAMAYRLISYLNVHGPREQGIYRVPGSTMAVDTLREEFARRHDVDLFQSPPDDVNTASSLLKTYIRELPEPILPPAFQKKLFDACRENLNSRKPPQVFVDLISSLPPQNYYLLQVLTNHLSNVALAEDVTRMGLSNLAMIFCSTMKVDRYTFNWLVGSWSDCWGGCWEENNTPGGNSVRISFDAGSSEKAPSYTDDTIGLGITSDEGRPVPREQPAPRPRKPETKEPPSSGTLGKSSRKRMSGVYDSPEAPAYDPERGRKRASREINWPTPATSTRSRRLSTESNSSTTGQAGFASGSTIRQVPREDTFDRLDSPSSRSFRMQARDRRSVDISQLAALAQQTSLSHPHSPAIDSPRLRHSPHTPHLGIDSPRMRDSPSLGHRKVSDKGPATPDKLGKQRARSAERGTGASTRQVELLPPMPPISPLMVSGNGNHTAF
ncbi:hypothetical protein ABW19_dt0208257 [Dactylella cylindrospora]|nr:hypothetical protein ABW19_dt0208257 [Dactylella cylindrospora]